MKYEIDPADLKPGDVIIADGGFTCLKEVEHCTVKEDINNRLYVPCAGSHDGDEYGKPSVDSRLARHFLDAMIDAGKIVGFIKGEVQS